MKDRHILYRFHYSTLNILASYLQFSWLIELFCLHDSILANKGRFGESFTSVSSLDETTVWQRTYVKFILRDCVSFKHLCKTLQPYFSLLITGGVKYLLTIDRYDHKFGCKLYLIFVMVLATEVVQFETFDFKNIAEWNVFSFVIAITIFTSLTWLLESN